jgi:hypothetical protein
MITKFKQTPRLISFIQLHSYCIKVFMMQDVPKSILLQRLANEILPRKANVSQNEYCPIEIHCPLDTLETPFSLVCLLDIAFFLSKGQGQYIQPVEGVFDNRPYHSQHLEPFLRKNNLENIRGGYHGYK